MSIAQLLASLAFGLSTVIVPVPAAAAPGAQPPRPSNNYNLTDTSQKLVDNRGRGFDALYGTRNVRFVLRGLVYRGGANNAMHRTRPRDNRNPLPLDGLQNLCAEGFGTAVYLYPTNYANAPREVTCTRREGAPNALAYRQLSPANKADMRKILETVHEALTRKDRVRPIYLHCWNGWHASGLAAAIVLRQFCGLEAEAAVRYWDRNTDGHERENGYSTFRQQIREFTPYADLTVDRERVRQFCPTPAELAGERPRASTLPARQQTPASRKDTLARTDRPSP